MWCALHKQGTDLPIILQIPMIFYGLVSGVALVLETAWKAAKAVGIDVPLPKALQEQDQQDWADVKM